MFTVNSGGETDSDYGEEELKCIDSELDDSSVRESAVVECNH